MIDALLIVNAGSSSLKFSVFSSTDRPEMLLRGQLENLLTHPHFVARDGTGRTVGEQQWPWGTVLGHSGAVQYLIEWGRGNVLASHRLVAAGHRVVHGGIKYDRPVRVVDETLADLEALIPLAPLHQPHNLVAIRSLAERVPGLPQVACFDTAFHRTQPGVAQAFALPRRFAHEGLRRYGFHGLSYEYIASKLPEFDSRAAAGRAVVAHLGNGASMCAIKGGRSAATTMSFSTVDGLPMGTRSGTMDPGVLIYLMDRHGMGARDLEQLLYHKSGLLGVSGISSDVRTLLASIEPSAADAIDLLVYRIGRELGSLAAALGGLDAIVFTGGIGENAVSIRARVCAEANWLGLKLDEVANQQGGPRISQADSAVSAWVIPTNEELMIAQHTQRVLTEGNRG